MKKLFYAIAVVALVCALVFPVAAFAFSADLFEQADYSLFEDGFTYKEKSTKEKGQSQVLFYGEYNATVADAKYEWVIHSVRNGTNTTKSTVEEIATDYQNKTGRKVMFAANGDYFDLGTGSNMESYVNNGIVVSKGAFITKHCIGFDNKGKAVVGRMTQTIAKIRIDADGENRLLDIAGYNRAPQTDDEITVYSEVGTYSVPDAGKYIVQIDFGSAVNLPAYGKCHRLKTGTPINDDEFTLKSGQFALVAKGQNASYFFDKLKYGTSVDLVEIPAGDYLGCTWVLGGYDILVNDGVVNKSCHTDNSGNVAAPRTFVGVKEDGTMFLCMLDGRQPGYSVGITVNAEAELASVLGAKHALELDGGGSTTVLVRIGDKLQLRNKPSDGQMRKVSNALMLVEKPSASPEPEPEPQPEPKPEPDPQPSQNYGFGCNGVVSGGIVMIFAAAFAFVVAKDKTNRK